MFRKLIFLTESLLVEGGVNLNGSGNNPRSPLIKNAIVCCFVCFITHNIGSSETPQLSLLIDDPLNAQRLSIISADGSEVDSDYSSASSIIHVSDGQRNLE